MPDTHSNLLYLYKELGYNSDASGLCHGFSIRWIEACLLGQQEEERFDNCINLITSQSAEHIVEEINRALNEKNFLSRPELLEIVGFYDSLAAFHHSLYYPTLFGQEWDVVQQDIEIISAIASSDAILKRGGLKVIYSEPLIYTKAEIKSYFGALGKILESATALSNEPIGVLLENKSHTVILKYESGQGWNFRDINQAPAPAGNCIADSIVKGFRYNNQSKYTAFNVKILLTGADHRNAFLHDKLEKFKNSHSITKDIACRSAGEINLVWIAAKYGHASIITALAGFGADLSHADMEGFTPAMFAAGNGHADVIEALAMHNVDFNNANNKGVTPVWFAARYGHIEIIKVLAVAEHEADLNQANNEGATPIWIAARNGHAEVINVLAEHEADLNQANNNGTTAVMIAAQNGHVNAIIELAAHGADLNKANNKGLTPAMIAAGKNNTEIIYVLAAFGADLNKANNKGVTPAWFAAANGHVNAIIELAAHGADLNQLNKVGATAAMMAAQNGYAEVIYVLAAFGADLNHSDNKGLTPTMMAAGKGHVGVINVLAVHYGADLLNQADKTGTTPAMVAAGNGRVNVINALAAHGADLNKANNKGVTPAWFAARYGHAEAIKALAAHKADLNKADEEAGGCTPAWMAAYCGHVNAIKALAVHKADLNQANNEGITPVWYAAQNGNHEVVALLLSYGATPGIFKATPDYLRKLANSQGETVVAQMDKFIASHKVDHENKLSLTPFDIAKIMGHQTILELLNSECNQSPKKLRRLK